MLLILNLQGGNSLFKKKKKKLSKQISHVELILFFPSYFMLEHTFENSNVVEICLCLTEYKFLLVAT